MLGRVFPVCRAGAHVQCSQLCSSLVFPCSPSTTAVQVYDVTDFVDDHPGGSDSIAKNPGQENTEAFFGPHHPDRAFYTLQDFYIGNLAGAKKNE